MKQLPNFSDRDFALLGSREFVYIKEMTIAGEDVVTIHAADGTPIKVTPDLKTALDLLKTNKMKRAYLH